MQREQGFLIEPRDLAGVRQMRAQMRLVGVLAGRVDDQRQMIAAIGDHQIVEDAAGRIREQRIALTILRDADNVSRHQLLERARRVGDRAGFRTQRNLSHMRHVEQAGGFARMQMLFENAQRILQRHRIAGERHHASAKLDMQTHATGFAAKRRRPESWRDVHDGERRVSKGDYSRTTTGTS